MKHVGWVIRVTKNAGPKSKILWMTADRTKKDTLVKYSLTSYEMTYGDWMNGSGRGYLELVKLYE